MDMTPEAFARASRRHQDRMSELIDRHGWALQGVFDPDGDPWETFTYTVGLHRRAATELCIFGMNMHQGGTILNDAAARGVAGEHWSHGQAVSELVVGYPLVVLDVYDMEPFGALRLMYGTGVPMQQLVWPDVDGYFPWQLACSLSPRAQRLLVRPPEDDTP